MAKWDERFFELAKTVANWSKDPTRKVGCVVVSPDRHRLTIGYNGFPKRIEDSASRLDDAELKNKLTVHAELNAILNAKTSLVGWSMYVTSPPCIECCKAIIQAGIRELICPRIDPKSKWQESNQMGIALLVEAGVNIVIVGDSNED